MVLIFFPDISTSFLVCVVEFYQHGVDVTNSVQMVMSTLTEQATKLLDFNQKLDIQLLDNVVASMYAGDGPQVSLCFRFRV